jgi:predicted MFS family arabinose efflux permease
MLLSAYAMGVLAGTPVRTPALAKLARRMALMSLVVPAGHHL